ncbi:MAG TPA: ATP-binding protein [Chloroflexota bacterium]
MSAEARGQTPAADPAGGIIGRVGDGRVSIVLAPRRWRLATRVTAAVVLLLLPIFLVNLVTYRGVDEERRRAEMENATAIGYTVAAVVDGFASDIEGSFLAAALGLGDRPGELDQPSIGPYLDALARQYPSLRAIFVVDPNGRVIASAQAAGVGTDLSARPYVQALRAGAETVWSDGIVGLQSGEITVVFGRTIPRPDRVARAYIVAAFYPPTLLERRFPLVLPSDADVTFLDRKGLILHSTSRPDLPLAERQGMGVPGVGPALAGRTTLVENDPTPFGPEPRFGALVPVPRTGWVVAFTRPRAPLDAALLQRFREQTLFNAAVVLLFAAALALVTRRLVQPLAQLVGTAAAITRGERPTVPSTTGDPEVVQLAEAMRVMSRAVAEREDALGRTLADARRTSQQLQGQTGRLSVLADASTALAAASTDLTSALETVTLHVAQGLGDGCAVLLTVDGGRTLELAALYHRSVEAHELARVLLDEGPNRTGGEIARRVLERGQALLVPRLDPTRDNLFVRPEHRVYAERFGLHSLVAVPLRGRERTIGVVVAWRDATERPYVDEDRALLQDVAERAVLAIENAWLYRSAQEQAAAQGVLNTALREVAEERDRALEAVREALRTRDEFLASASHDLKNPLVTIKGAAQIARRLLERADRVETARLIRLLTSVDSAATSMAGQIEALLDVARLRAGRPLELNRRPTDLVALARAAAAEYQQTTEIHRIRVEAPEPEVRGEWDASRLERVLGNLLSNAIKYSPEGGEITVTIGRESDGASGDQAVLRVRDQGLGIPPASQPLVFDRFRRGDNVGPIAGTGLGLAGVKAIVEQHGGTIVLESQAGQGSTFTVRLPVAGVGSPVPSP